MNFICVYAQNNYENIPKTSIKKKQIICSPVVQKYRVEYLFNLIVLFVGRADYLVKSKIFSNISFKAVYWPKSNYISNSIIRLLKNITNTLLENNFTMTISHLCWIGLYILFLKKFVSTS